MSQDKVCLNNRTKGRWDRHTDRQTDIWTGGQWTGGGDAWSDRK